MVVGGERNTGRRDELSAFVAHSMLRRRLASGGAGRDGNGR